MPAQTRGSEFEKLIATECSALRKLATSHYTTDDLRAFLSSQGTRFETFLKTTTFPSKSPKGTFDKFIGYLPSSVSADASKLHALRRTYNDAKHDPIYAPCYVDLLRLMTEALAAIQNVNRLGLGLTNSPAPRNARRLFWLIVYDFYAHGDSEIVITLPGDSDRWLGPRPIDRINIKIDKLDDVCKALSALGKLEAPDAFIPAKLIKEWAESDSEFYRAYVFEGEYRDIITTLAQHELRQDLIHDLNRGDDEGNVMVAVLLAAVDLAAANSLPGIFADQVKHRAKSVYALPDDAAGLGQFVCEVEVLFQGLGRDVSSVTGPIWVSGENFDALTARARGQAETMPVVIDENFRLVIRQRQ